MLTLVFVLLLTIQISAQRQTVELRMGLVTAPTQAMTMTAHKFAELINELTNGQVKITVFDSGVLGSEDEIVSCVKLGTIHMAGANYQTLAEWLPLLGVFSPPSLFRDKDHYLRVVTGPVGQLIHEELRKAEGMRVLYNTYLGEIYLTSNKPYYTPADFKGVKMRAFPTSLSIANINALGSTPITVAFSDLYMALQTHMVETQENSLATVVSVKLYEIQKYALELKSRFNGSVGIINEEVFQSLEPEIQNIFLEAGKIATFYNNYLILEQEAKAKQFLQDKGMKIITAEDGLDIDAFTELYKNKVWVQFLEEWGGQEMIDKILNE